MGGGFLILYKIFVNPILKGYRVFPFIFKFYIILLITSISI